MARANVQVRAGAKARMRVTVPEMEAVVAFAVIHMTSEDQVQKMTRSLRRRRVEDKKEKIAKARWRNGIAGENSRWMTCGDVSRSLDDVWRAEPHDAQGWHADAKVKRDSWLHERQLTLGWTGLCWVTMCHEWRESRALWLARRPCA